MKDKLELDINTQKIVLSSSSLFYKTENFIKETKFATNIDLLISKLCETILLNLSTILENEKYVRDDIGCFSITTEDNQLSLSFKFGYQIGQGLNQLDIVFFDYSNNGGSNQTPADYIKSNSKIKITKNKKLNSSDDFKKLYLISISGVNLPRLSREQKDIVETVDKNVLVQGVAGSGKTNICIDKIIFTACKNYTGKVLYTTFSRGLLNDTKLKVELFKKDLEEIMLKHKSSDIIFLDNNHKKALENRLGIYFFSDDDNHIFDKIQRVINYLTSKVDYYLIEDLYKQQSGNENRFVDENYFINIYAKNLTNYQIKKCFDKLSSYSKEIIYKEIYGMIFGYYNLTEKSNIMPLNQYILSRKDSFSRQECECIYQIALDFKKHCVAGNLIDNNSASKKLIENFKGDFVYSLSIIDEVQDYTQANLCLFKNLSLKLFCVGDALQMINPSYFNFGYLKNLLFEKDLTEVKELKNNYRNTAKIEQIIDELGKINKAEFGTHSFVLKGQSIDNGIKSTAVFVQDVNFIKDISHSGFDNFTFVVANMKQKNELQKIIKNQEVLTVSEIKGLERSTIVTFNILSTNVDKWQLLDRQKVNHKQADENSVYRYYYNLFYVGLSRAKQNIFVVENESVKQFENFFKENFDYKNSKGAIKLLSEIVSKVEFTQEEIFARINEFLKLGQYDNARFTANKIQDDKTRIDYLRTIDIYENLIHYGKYREAGIKFWEYGLIDEAKKQFTLSNDTMLIELIDSCSKNSSKNLSIDIIEYLLDVKDNQFAVDFILETAKNDVKDLRNSFSSIKENFKTGELNGK